MSAALVPVTGLSNLTAVYQMRDASNVDGACCVRPAVSVGIFPDPMHDAPDMHRKVSVSMHVASMQQQLHERPAHLVPTPTNGATP